jgi:hypothetical protein
MKHPVWLSTFLFAAVLSPVVLQADTCTPIGNARLAVLELWVPDVQGVNVIEGFESYVLFYDAEFPASEATGLLRVEAEEPTASIEARHDSVLVPLGSDGSASLDVPMGTSELRITVSVDTGGALPYSWTYVVSIERGAEGVLSIGIDVEEGAGGGGGSG